MGLVEIDPDVGPKARRGSVGSVGSVGSSVSLQFSGRVALGLVVVSFEQLFVPDPTAVCMVVNVSQWKWKWREWQWQWAVARDRLLRCLSAAEGLLAQKRLPRRR